MSTRYSYQGGATGFTKDRQEIIEIHEDHLMEEQPELSEDIVLKRKEEFYRACLKNDPGNHEARAALARCLFLQWAARSAVFRQEDQGEDLMTSTPLDVLQRGMQELEVSRMLAECLHHALTTYQLSPSASHRAEMKRMQKLVYQAGREGAIEKAKMKMVRAAASLMQEMLLGPDVEIQDQKADAITNALDSAPGFSLFLSRRETAH